MMKKRNKPEHVHTVGVLYDLSCKLAQSKAQCIISLGQSPIILRDSLGNYAVTCIIVRLLQRP